MLIYILSFTIGYLSGSILFAWVVTKIVTGKDIRKIGDGNAGANNVLLNVGHKYGVTSGILDLLKVIIPMLFGILLGLDDISIILIAIGGVIGHLYPIYFKFKGGRGATCTLASYVVLLPIEMLISTITTLTLLLTIKRLKSKALFLVSPLIILLALGLSFLFSHSMAVRIGAFIIPLITLIKKKNVDELIRYTRNILSVTKLK